MIVKIFSQTFACNRVYYFEFFRLVKYRLFHIKNISRSFPSASISKNLKIGLWPCCEFGNSKHFLDNESHVEVCLHHLNKVCEQDRCVRIAYFWLFFFIFLLNVSDFFRSFCFDFNLFCLRFLFSFSCFLYRIINVFVNFFLDFFNDLIFGSTTSSDFGLSLLPRGWRHRTFVYNFALLHTMNRNTWLTVCDLRPQASVHDFVSMVLHMRCVGCYHSHFINLNGMIMAIAHIGDSCFDFTSSNFFGVSLF